VAVGEQIKKAL